MAGSTTGRKLGKAEEPGSFPLRKNVEWPIDLSHCTDNFQTPCIESRPALAEIDRSSGVLARCDPIATERSPERREPLSRVMSDRTTSELTSVAWSTIVSPSAGPDTLQVSKPDLTGQSAWSLSRSDVPNLFGLAVTSPSDTDRAKLPFIGHPLTYLFSQPTQQLSSHQRLRILLPNSPPVVSAVHSEHPATTKSSEFSDLGLNPEKLVSAMSDDLANLSRTDLRKFVAEKVIEAAYSKEPEHEPSIQSFPKTKKQLAIDKLSSNKPNTPTHNRNGNLELCGVTSNAVSQLTSVPSSAEGAATLEAIEKMHEERRSAAAKESNVAERNGDVAAMTIGEINEKLIMKVVQEEDATTSVHNSPVSESRMPLKLQKKYKKLDGVGHSGSSSASFGSSSPDQSCSSVLDFESSSALTSDNQLQPQFSGLAQKSGFPGSGAQKVNIFMNANLLAAYPEFLRSGSLLAGERQQLGSTTSSSTAGQISMLGFHLIYFSLCREIR